MTSSLPPHVAAALGLSPAATVSAAPQGMTSEVAFVLDGGRESVLKRCRDPRYLDWLRRERRVLDALAGSPVPAPRALGFHEDLEDGRVVEAWLLMTRLPGSSLWDLLLRSGADARTRLLRTLGRTLARLHATPPPPVLSAGRAWIDRRLDEARDNLSWCDGPATLLARLDSDRPPAHRETLIHGDLSLDNVLVDADGEINLIDWSNGDIGDPRYDVSLALATDPEIDLSAAERAAFHNGYGRPPLDSATTRWFVDLYEFF